MTICEGYTRLAAVRRGDSDGYGEVRSLTNFLTCVVARRLQELQPLGEWFVSLPVNVQCANLQDSIMGDLIDEWLQLRKLAQGIRATLGPTCPSTPVAPYRPEGDIYDSYAVRYDWLACRWLSRRPGDGLPLSWANIREFHLFAGRLAR